MLRCRYFSSRAMLNEKRRSNISMRKKLHIGGKEKGAKKSNSCAKNGYMKGSPGKESFEETYSNSEKLDIRYIRRKNIRSANLNEELHKASFLEYNFKTDIYLKLNELKIFNPTQIQSNVIPLLLQRNGKNISPQKNDKLGMYEHKNIYNEILKNRMYINTYLKMNLNMNSNFYDVEKYKGGDHYKEMQYLEEKKEIPRDKVKTHSDEKKKCFNDVYVIISPDNTGKTLSYFLPILDNFYTNNEYIMKNLSNFYNFLNKYNYKKFRNKLFRKKEKLRYFKNKENLFFNISYEKYKIRNRYVHMRKYRNYNANNSYIKNKRNNKLNCLKHKKNVFFPYAIILTNTREAALELFSFLKFFDINIELLSGGYLNKKKSIKKYHVESFSGYHPNNDAYNVGTMSNYDTGEAAFLNTYDFIKRIKKNAKGKNVINYNIDILVGTPDKIFEKVDNWKNKHLYNFKFLKYVVVEECETLCNAFNEKKLQLIFNHIKNYTNMYYFRGTVVNDDTLDGAQNGGDKKCYDLEIENVSSRKRDSLLHARGVKTPSEESFEGDDEMTEWMENQYESTHHEGNSVDKKDVKNDSNSDKRFSNTNGEEVISRLQHKMDNQVGGKKHKGGNVSGGNYELEKKLQQNYEQTENFVKNSEHAGSAKNGGRGDNLEVILSPKSNGNMEPSNIRKSETTENVKNTLNSNIPISIFVSATKTFCISEFLSNNIRSKYVQQIINMNSHNISSEIKHVFINSKNKEKVALLLELLNNKSVKNVSDAKCSPFFSRYVIFCNTRKSVLNLADILSELKYRVSFIHNEMNYRDRSRNYREFKKGKTNILICTNILSRGVHFENCEIINYDISNNINDYIYKSSKVSFKKYNNKNDSLTSFFNKKNTALVKDIVEKTGDKKQIIFQNLNKKVSRMLKLHNNYYDIVRKKKKYQKRGGRKALKISPRRNCLSKENKILSKKLYFYNKMNIERKRLIKKGILKPHEKIPRYPNRKAEVYDSNEYNFMTKLDDGALQIIAKKRKTKKEKIAEETHYEQDTIVLDSMPTYEDEAKIKEKGHQKKTYF
ncbi:RNA helicase, putative [Plasmodium ovale wallikeri]|uniref:RNA helicase, putative n=2 Tax=Plasmodium ovale TaxID=36330 RepID=A0A1A8YFQ4_PLAOA|nr:RNA helicase, putative [Plasmodium ovale wallikeri]SBT30752.1 RNA helicase, putative [Plasmodium ovale wallikeri]SBT75127.1 RNA helicase, putative [Plasmodium ovale]